MLDDPISDGPDLHSFVLGIGERKMWSASLFACGLILRNHVKELLEIG